MDLHSHVRYNIEDYIKLNTAYTAVSAPVLLDVLNAPDIFIALTEKCVRITKADFESNIRNSEVGMSYVDFYNPDGNFYEFSDDTDNTAAYFIIEDEQIVMFFEVEKLPS